MAAKDRGSCQAGERVDRARDGFFKSSRSVGQSEEAASRVGCSEGDLDGTSVTRCSNAGDVHASDFVFSGDGRETVCVSEIA